MSYLFKGDFSAYRSLFLENCPPPMLMPKGSRICKKGITRGWMYYLTEGLLKVYSSNFQGYERLVAFLREDSIFGLDCFDPTMPSIVTIECVSDAWVMPFQRETLKKVMEADENFAYDLVSHYSKILRQLCFDAENQSINDSGTRLANFLYLYVENSQSRHVDMSQQELAAAVNCSRSSIARICNALKEEGIIETNGRGLTVVSKVRLEKLCHF